MYEAATLRSPLCTQDEQHDHYQRRETARTKSGEKIADCSRKIKMKLNLIFVLGLLCPLGSYSLQLRELPEHANPLWASMYETPSGNTASEQSGPRFAYKVVKNTQEGQGRLDALAAQYRKMLPGKAAAVSQGQQPKQPSKSQIGQLELRGDVTKGDAAEIHGLPCGPLPIAMEVVGK